MRVSTASFVGAGTIVVALAIGLGGGIVAGNIMAPVAPREGPDTSKLAQRTGVAAEPVKTGVPSEHGRDITGSQTPAAVIAAPAQARDDAQPEPQTTPATTEQAPAPMPLAQIAKPAVQQASTEPQPFSENASAKARESDAKRTAFERRRSDRRERWAERHRYDSREQRVARDRTDWDDVARNVLADSDARDVAVRPRNTRMLFGPGDD
jgi:hypothetical protein